MMTIKNVDEITTKRPRTILLYGDPGVGKSTAIGLIAEQREGNVLVLDVDRTIINAISKKEVIQNNSHVLIAQVDPVDAFNDWNATLTELAQMCETGELARQGITAIAVDNLSELERCLLSDLGAQGNNRGIPAQGDYQVVQFKILNSLRFLKSLGLDLILTAWQDVRTITNMDGTSYSQLVPKISLKIVDNVCGLCDIVGKIFINKEGRRGVVLEPRATVYAKNQLDARKACPVESILN